MIYVSLPHFFPTNKKLVHSERCSEYFRERERPHPINETAHTIEWALLRTPAAQAAVLLMSALNGSITFCLHRVREVRH